MTLAKKLTIKILNLKLVILLEYLSKCNNIFARGYVANWAEEVLIITKVKNTVLWRYVISGFIGAKIVGLFYKEILQKTNQKEFSAKKVIKQKDDKLCVKWKGRNSSFNS